MEITIEDSSNVAIVRCRGSLDAQTVAAFKRVAAPLIEAGRVRIILDFSAVDFVDSMGLGALISLLRRAREREGDVKVAALVPDVRTIFEITRLHRLFDVCDDVAGAEKKFA